MTDPEISDSPPEPMADHPTIQVDWHDGDIAYRMHNMSGAILHAIAGVLAHEAEKLLFEQDMARAREDARAAGKGAIVTPFGRN
ncbi:MAG: hypothetical protein ACYDAK_12995 [Candidatus Limnocylindrales bacterium]